MNRFLLPLLTASALLLATGAHAQDKPVLNTTPPGSRPAPTPQPAQQPTPTTPSNTTPPNTTPTPEPGPQPETGPTTVPQAQPTPDNPSGLNFPGRPTSTSGFGGPALTAKKYFVYTNFGLGFNSFDGLSQFSLSAAPALGYRFTDKFSAGPGISYAYGSYSLPDGYVFTSNGENTIATSSLGFKVFAQFMVYKEFFAHGEYEVTNAEILNSDFDKVKKTISTPLLGAGYRTEFSSNAAADIVILYNFNDSIYSGLYGQPVIRFNFLFNIGR